VQVQESCTPAWSAENFTIIHHTSPGRGRCAVTPCVQHSGKEKLHHSHTTKNDLAIHRLQTWKSSSWPYRPPHQRSPAFHTSAATHTTTRRSQDTLR